MAGGALFSGLVLFANWWGCAFSLKVVDRVGAGDAFFAVTSPCVYREYDEDLIGLVGNCVGALAVETVGNRQPVDPTALYKFISHIFK